jgi:hypothetical protein
LDGAKSKARALTASKERGGYLPTLDVTPFHIRPDDLQVADSEDQAADRVVSAFLERAAPAATS